MYKKIVVLTGAGVSQESGLNTFRGGGGLWEGHRIEDVATPEAFERNPDLVYKFYNERRIALHSDNIKPNNAHVMLSEFEKSFSGDFTLITQNVDNLHERAGSKNILHIHGELLKARSLKSGKVIECKGDLDAYSESDAAPGERLRPHIVWFGEMPFYMDEIEKKLLECDLFISIGTSGLVYPAAAFVRWVSPKAKTVELNLDDTPSSDIFDESIRGKASEIVKDYFEKIKSQ